MIELNFGKPEFAHRCPGPGYPQCIADLVVQIPLSGELPTFARRGTKMPPGGYRGGGTYPPYIYGPGGYEFTEYEAVMALTPQQREVQGRPAVVMGLKRQQGLREDIELILLWVAERAEWVVIWHKTWQENAWGDDESYDGPFAINEECASKILEAYGIPEGALGLEAIRRMDPLQSANEALS